MRIARHLAPILLVSSLATGCGGQSLAPETGEPRGAEPPSSFGLDRADETGPQPSDWETDATPQVQTSDLVPVTPMRDGEWTLDNASGLWLHDNGRLVYEPRGNGVLYDLTSGYVADFNTGMVYNPYTGQWFDPYGQPAGNDWANDGSGWSYDSMFGYGASDGTTTAFNLGDGCTVLDGVASC